MTTVAITHLKRVDSRLKKVIEKIGEIQIRNHNDSFLFLVSEIVGQMLSATVQKVLFQRLMDMCCGELTPNNILQHSEEEFRSIGISKAKASYIQNLAKMVENNTIIFERFQSQTDAEVIKELTAIKGIGKWTAKMYLLFFLKREDVLPYEDGAFLQAYKWLYNTKTLAPKSIQRRCKHWKPYSSIAARYLYIALDSGLTKTNIKSFLSDEEI